jgi:hypothetical protein
MRDLNRSGAARGAGGAGKIAHRGPAVAGGNVESFAGATGHGL